MDDNETELGDDVSQPGHHISRRNPLALMVLCTLWEQPTHPYQLVQTLKQRRKDKSARLNYGSLYTVIANLERANLIEAVEVTQVGNLPPRTTYQVTPAGVEELTSWLSDLIGRPEPEIPQFMTALSLLPTLPVEQVLALLRQRLTALEKTMEEMAAQREQSRQMIPELLYIEASYQAAITEAEYVFTRLLIDDIESGDLSGVAAWRVIHATKQNGRPNYEASAAAFAAEGFPVI